MPAEREDGPAAAAERLAARADFAVGEAEQPGHEEGQEKQRPEDRLGNEDEAACIPARIEGEEGTQAVVVGPVEQQVAERGDEGGEIEPAPMDWLPRVPVGLARLRFELGAPVENYGALRASDDQEPDRADDDGGDDGHGDEGVGDAAMVLELFDGAGESPEDVEVGGFGGQHGGQGGVGGLAVEAGAADAGTGKKMSDGLHRALGTILTGRGPWDLKTDSASGQSHLKELTLGFGRRTASEAQKRSERDHRRLEMWQWLNRLGKRLPMVAGIAGGPLQGLKPAVILQCFRHD